MGYLHESILTFPHYVPTGVFLMLLLTPRKIAADVDFE
jgi:hypothetical protein